MPSLSFTSMSLGVAAWLLGSACQPQDPRQPAQPRATAAAIPDAASPPVADPTSAGVRPPATRTVANSEVHHGVTVEDPYRWLESWDDDAVRAWSAAQTKYARAVLDGIGGREAIRDRVRAVFGAETVAYWDVQLQGERVFAMKRQPPKQQPFIVVADRPEAIATGRVLIDPAAIDPSGHTAIDFYAPSPDGTLIAVSLSKAGTERGDVHIFDVATGKATGEVVDGVNGGTAGGDVAWRPDGAGFWYTRYPRGDERPAADRAFFVQLYWHALGTDTATDTYELGKGLPRIAEYQLQVDATSGRVLCTVQDGDGGEFAHFLRAPEGTWRQFSDFGDKTLVAAFGSNDDLYVMSRAGAPKGKILRLPIATLDVAKAEIIVPAGDDAIVEDFWGPPTVLPTATRLYVLYQRGGPSEIRAFTLDGQPASAPQQSAVSAQGGMARAGAADDLLFWSASYLAPRRYRRFDAAAGTTTDTAIATEAPVSFDGVEVVREMATSKDGTRVPVNILFPPGFKRDGSGAMIVTGYGGYGVNLVPRYRARNKLMLERNVAVAVANLRGGGEYGEAWHRGGNLTNKQNVFDDFHAVLTHVVDKRYTTPARLGIVGGSNGGLLMGAMLTQHPQAMKAVVSFVGIYDMLRVELSANGAFNVPEFGTVKNEAHFKAMLAYSPYHQVKRGVSYPPTLFLTGANDPRVDAMQSRKMTARMQAAVAASSTPTRPVLLLTSLDAGHGSQTKLDERVAQWTDVLAFFFDQL